jgi:hypothetical protein
MLLLMAVALAGCKSATLSSYVSPRVTGRVLAMDSREPVAGVKVKRVTPRPNRDMASPPRGGQSMEQTPAVWTGRDGRFALDSERVLSVFRQPGWYSVAVSFEHPNYLRFETNYTTANVSSQSSGGEPLVNAGDILLLPASK